MYSADLNLSTLGRCVGDALDLFFREANSSPQMDRALKQEFPEVGNRIFEVRNRRGERHGFSRRERLSKVINKVIEIGQSDPEARAKMPRGGPAWAQTRAVERAMHADLGATLLDSPTESGRIEVGPLPGGDEPGRFDCLVWRHLRKRATKRKFELKADDAGKATFRPSPLNLPCFSLVSCPSSLEVLCSSVFVRRRSSSTRTPRRCWSSVGPTTLRSQGRARIEAGEI